MTAAEWEPGDPFMPDNGCGTVPPINLSPQEQIQARREDDTPPPWYRPEASTAGFGWNHHCKACGVQWRGDDPCWMCGGATE